MKTTILLSGLLLSFCLRGMNLQDPSKQYWDGKFFHKATKQSLPLAKTILDECALEKYTSVLDVGCGPGDITAYIAKKINQKNGEVIGLDPSQSMINFAKDYYGEKKNILFLCEELPWVSLYDFIFSCNMFHLLPRIKQVSALQRWAFSAKKDQDVPLLIIMAAKTKEPQPFSRAYAATIAMNRWQALRSINLDDYFQPHDQETIKEVIKETPFTLTKTQIVDEHIKFKSLNRLKKFITSWMGGFEFVAQLPEKERKKLMRDLLKNYVKEVPVAQDGSIEWRSPRLIVHAEKPKEI